MHTFLGQHAPGGRGKEPHGPCVCQSENLGNQCGTYKSTWMTEERTVATTDASRSQKPHRISVYFYMTMMLTTRICSATAATFRSPEELRRESAISAVDLYLRTSPK